MPDHHHLAIVSLDRDLCLRGFAPPAASGLFGLVTTDVGQPLRDLAWKFADDGLLAASRAVLDLGGQSESEITAESGRKYLRTILAEETRGERAEGVVIVFCDITDRQRIERVQCLAEEQLRATLESLHEHAIFYLDREARMTGWPKTAERIFGYSALEAMGRPIGWLRPDGEDYVVATHEALAAARVRGRVESEGWWLRKDGTRFLADGILSTVRDRDGTLAGFVAVVPDLVSQRKRDEALRQAKECAEEASAAKDRFLTIAAHELRTPLSGVSIWANLIDRSQGMDRAQLTAALEAIKASVAEQRDLIDDLLDTVRIEHGEFEVETAPADLVAVARSALSTVARAADENQVKFATSFDAGVGMVKIDALQVRRLMGKLLANAVKFTGAAGEVRLTVRRQADEVQITVRDSGEGFEPERQSQLFNRRWPEAGARRKVGGGLGVGLLIAAEIVTLHGGTLAGESPGPGLGATFTVRLPLPFLGAVANQASQS